MQSFQGTTSAGGEKLLRIQSCSMVKKCTLFRLLIIVGTHTGKPVHVVDMLLLLVFRSKYPVIMFSSFLVQSLPICI